MVIDKMLYTFWIVVSIVLSSVIRLSCHLLMLYVVNLEITACILDLNNCYHLSENASINSLTPSFVLLLCFGATSVCISRCLAAAYSGRKCMQRYIYELLYFFLIESMYNIKFQIKINWAILSIINSMWPTDSHRMLTLNFLKLLYPYLNYGLIW